VHDLGQIKTADRFDPGNTDKVDWLQQRIAAMTEEMLRPRLLEARMLKPPGQRLSFADADARSMATSGRGSGAVGYNAQSTVDARDHPIVAHDVTNVGDDHSQLHNTARQAREAPSVEELEVVADLAHDEGEELPACERDNVTTCPPEACISSSVKKALFGKRDFTPFVRESRQQRNGREAKYPAFNLDAGSRTRL
jgi:hypothetical protein